MPKKRPAFTHHVRRDADVDIVALRGHLDNVATRDLKPALEELLDGGARRVVFDCRGLDYLSLSGLRIMLVVARDLQRRGGLLVVCNVVAELSEIFRLTRMDRIIPVFDSLDAAVAASRMAPGSAAPHPRSPGVNRRGLLHRLQGLNFDVTFTDLKLKQPFDPWGS